MKRSILHNVNYFFSFHTSQQVSAKRNLKACAGCQYAILQDPDMLGDPHVLLALLSIAKLLIGTVNTPRRDDLPQVLTAAASSRAATATG